MVTTRSFALSTCALVLLAVVVPAQQAPDFAGTWTASLPDGGTGTFRLEQQPDGKVKGTYKRSDAPDEVPVEGAVRPDQVLQADMVAPDGQRYRWEGRMAPEGQAFTAKIFLPGQEPREQVFRKQAASGGQPNPLGQPQNPLDQPRNPLGGGGPQNPLAAPPRPAWAATWSDGQVKLVLEPAAAAGALQGSITVQGATYPVKGQATPPKLQGAFTVQGHDFPFTATHEGDVLTLMSEGTTYTLRKEQPPAQPAQPANPLGSGPTPPPPPPPPQPPAPTEGGEASALTGVYPGPVQPMRLGGASFDVPQGWQAQQQDEGVLLVNPGAGANQTIEAMALVAQGELEPEERGKTPVQHLTEDGPALCENFGLTQARSAGPPRAVTVNALPGAEGTWTGTLQNGIPASVWCGVITTPTHYFMVAIVIQQGREQEYLPRAKRMVASARLR